ncbi:MAG: hypothetical protein JRE23_08615 [Deltaproteobacteria bacterium]|nr:hypothetical protein [Deltaproteobacteria bacterium]
MMMKRYLIFLALMLWTFIYISGCALFYPPKGDRYYFPELYRGWVCVHYNIEGAPQLPIEDGYLVHKIPENGLLVTSSAPRLAEPQRSEDYYYSNKGVRKAKELQHGGGYTKQQKVGLKEEIKLYFWISCCGHVKSDYDNYIKNHTDIDSDPKCGRWNQ